MTELRRGWESIPFTEAAERVSDQGRRLRLSAYDASGPFPVIDQGQTSPGGWTDRLDLLYSGPLPIIAFGDHTRTVRLITEPFVVGAEGLKLFAPRFHDARFFSFWLSQAVIPNRGYSRHSQFLKELSVPLPPFPEQRRILAEIEKHFTRLDEAARLLESVARKVSRVENCLLASAVSTEDTHLWTSSLKAGRKHYPESDLGKKTQPDPEVKLMNSRHWIIRSLDQLTTKITSGSRDWSPFYGRGTGTFILAQNVRPRKLDLTARQAVDPPADDPSTIRSAIRLGDLLVTIVGANTGDVCAVNECLKEHYVCQSVALVRPLAPEWAKYLAYYLSDDFFGRRIWKKYIYGAGRPHLSFEQLKKTPILLPPKDVLPELMSQVESLETTASSTQKALTELRSHARRLRRAILAKAFSGQLAPQDPNDEPASALLERIRAERTGTASHRPKRSARTKAAVKS